MRTGRTRLGRPGGGVTGRSGATVSAPTAEKEVARRPRELCRRVDSQPRERASRVFWTSPLDPSRKHRRQSARGGVVNATAPVRGHRRPRWPRWARRRDRSSRGEHRAPVVQAGRDRLHHPAGPAVAGGVSDHDRAPQAVRCTLGQPRGATHAAHSVLASGSLQRPLGSPTTAPPTLHHPRSM